MTFIKRLKSKLVIGMWLLLLMGYVFLGLWFVPFHGDESTQTFMSRDFAYTFIERDLGKIFYREPPLSPQEQELRIINGTINKYTIGVAWFVAGGTVDDVNEQWDWAAPYDYNLQTGHHPGEGLLPIVRVPSTLFTAVGVVVIFMLGWQLGGALTAYATSLLYATNPIILVNGRRAMMEGSMMFGALLIAFVAIGFVRSGRWRGGITLGVAAGFALAAKQTNLFAVGTIYVACATYVLWRQRHDAQRLLAFGLSGVVAASTFLALNPAWWQDPVGTAVAILEARTNLLQIQTDVFGSYPNVLAQLGGFWRQVIVGRAMYYEVPGWDVYIGNQIMQYEQLLLGGYHLPAAITGILLIVGLVGIWRGNEQTDFAARWIVGWWVVGVTLATLLLTPLEWQRYYLPAVPGLMLMVGHGAAIIITTLLSSKWVPSHNREPSEANINT